LATGLYAIRSLPSIARARVPEKKTSAALPQPAVTPATAVPAASQAPVAVPPSPEAPVEIAKPAEGPRLPPHLSSQTVRRTKKPENRYALLATGADSQPAAILPSRPAHLFLSEAPEPSLQSSDRMEEPGTAALPAASGPIPGLMAAPQ